MQPSVSLVLSFVLGIGLLAKADTTSCITSTRILPTLTVTTEGSTTTWGIKPTNGHQTSAVYVTAYPEFCSTGTRLREYTITEYCSEDVECPCRTRLPPGFHSTVAVCSSCGPETITATLTLPIAEATATGKFDQLASEKAEKKLSGQTGHIACTTCEAPERPTAMPARPSVGTLTNRPGISTVPSASSIQRPTGLAIVSGTRKINIFESFTFNIAFGMTLAILCFRL